MSKKIYKAIQDKQQSILSRWVPAALGDFCHNEPLTVHRVKDRFSDPLGYAIASNAEAILQWLINDDQDIDLSKPLEAICRIKAVQDHRPSESLHFIFDLKTIIRESLGESSSISHYAGELWEVDRRIDEMALLAFDLFGACRNQIYQLQAQEIKRMYGRGLG